MFDDPRDHREFVVAEPLSELLPEAEVEPEVNTAAQPEARGFELPGRIWLGMSSCYALFLAIMAGALGSSGKAMLSIAISAVYVLVFFSVARIVIKQNPVQAASPLDREGFLMTHFGPMDRKAVYGQVLVVPAAIVFFGVAVSVIIALTGNPA